MLEQEGDGVRLMTVHRAKGLEFPVVILADLTAKLTSSQGDRFVDAERGVCAQTLLDCGRGSCWIRPISRRSSA